MSIQKLSGRIIVIEGLDKSGKTTQSNLLFNYLIKKNPDKVVLMDFPDYSTQIGKIIRDFLDGKSNFNNETMHMLLAANRREKREIIEGLLEKDNTIVMNRYYQSNLAYGIANGISKDWLMNLDAGIPKESITIILDIDPKVTHTRAVNNNFSPDTFEQNIDFLHRARLNYLCLAEDLGWKIIPSDTDKDKVFTLILESLGE
jgi:dTMP kinase